MKKLVAILLLSTFLITSCKKENQQSEEPIQEVTTKTFEVAPGSTKITWTAYKTTAKTPVKGTFTTLNIDKPIKSDSKQGAFSNLKFNIPISSFFSKNEIRDDKIKKMFFGVMEQTSLISGHFSNITGNEDEGTLTLNIKMNNELVAIPMKYTITDNNVTIDGTISNLMDWKMEKAFNSLHKACELLHTGEDGISRTWEDVHIQATTVLIN